MKLRKNSHTTGQIANVVLFGVMLFLSGCQNLQKYLPGDHEPPVVEVADIESEHFSLDAEQVLIGQQAEIVTRSGDTLVDIARHFGLGLSEIEIANPGVDLWTPESGQIIHLPLQFMLPDTPKKGVVINLASMRLFRYSKTAEGSLEVSTYPTGIGRDGWDTPRGATHILRKTANPSWYVPASIRKEHAEKGDPLPAIVGAGPDNPLGEYAMHLAMPSYLIHGTNKPYGVGLRISHGCIRLYPEDIEQLFHQVDVKTEVRIVDQPYLVGWQDQRLFLEAHPPLSDNEPHNQAIKDALFEKIREQAKQHSLEQSIDWTLVEQVLQQANGVPTAIIKPAIEPVSFQTASRVRVTHPDELLGELQIPQLTATDWALQIDQFNEVQPAQKLTAILNHQGPPIPTRFQLAEDGYTVISGPFPDKASAEKASKRLKMDFEIETKLITPE